MFEMVLGHASDIALVYRDSCGVELFISITTVVWGNV